MQVILLQDVKSLGKKGDIVKVSDGYAKNYVIPQKLGVEASSPPFSPCDLEIKSLNAPEPLVAAKQGLHQHLYPGELL